MGRIGSGCHRQTDRPRGARARAGTLLICATAGCATAVRPETDAAGRRLPPASKIDFFEEGDVLLIGVGTRAARLSGPEEFLPLHLVIANKREKSLVVSRESFTLELPDGTLLPLATFEEFRADHGGILSDRRLALSFYDNIGGRFPTPTFRWIELEFFPVPGLGPVPRETIELLPANVTFGNLYFRRGTALDPPESGWHSLLFRPAGTETTYVVDLVPFR